MRSVQTVDRFVEDRRARWARLADLTARAQGRVSRLSADEVLELGELYRGATSDLAIARRHHPRDAVSERLNDLGAVFAVLNGTAGKPALLTFIVAHGFLEISAIVLSAGAGLRIAWAMLHPGELSRPDALRLAGQQAVRVLLLTVVVLAVAGT